MDEVQTALEGEPPMPREVQNDGLTVDADADMLDCISVGLCGRCYWNRFRTGYFPRRRWDRVLRTSVRVECGRIPHTATAVGFLRTSL
jgi:hypothetical protein